MRPFTKVTSCRLASARAEPSALRAYLNRVSRTVSQASCTAVPAEAAVQEPPSTGEVGSDESAMRAVTSSMSRPSASAPIWVRIV
jgi:hypothetical protein